VVTVTASGGQRDDRLTALGRQERKGLLNQLGIGALFIGCIIIADSLIFCIFFDLERIPVMFEHSLHVARSFCILEG